MIKKYKRTNPFSGESEMLTNEEAILYDQVKMAEINEDYKPLQSGLDTFSRLTPQAYLTVIE